MSVRLNGGLRCACASAGFVMLGLMSSAHGAVSLLTDGNFDDHAGNVPSHNVRPGGQGGWIWAGTAGIDTGNPYGTYNGAPAAPNCVAFNADPTSGVSQMGFIEGGGSGSGLTVAAQDFTAVVGQLYQVDFEAKAIAGGNATSTFTVDPMYVSIFANGALAVPLFGGLTISPSSAGPDTNGYTHYTATFVAPNPALELDFYDAGGQPATQVTWIDAVSVTASVPEPVSMGLLLVGAVGLIGRRRRI